jgi:hypothetical protein
VVAGYSINTSCYLQAQVRMGEGYVGGVVGMPAHYAQLCCMFWHIGRAQKVGAAHTSALLAVTSMFAVTSVHISASVGCRRPNKQVGYIITVLLRWVDDGSEGGGTSKSSARCARTAIEPAAGQG